MNPTAIPTVSRSETTVLHLTPAQISTETAEPTTGRRVAVLEAGGLGRPLVVPFGDETADRIVVGYEVDGNSFERSWNLTRSTATTSYYGLAGDSSSAGYVSAA
jgi:hypothetical protein